MSSPRILVISDTQAPFHHKDALEFLTYYKNVLKPTHVVHIGDAMDFNALSDYVPNPDGLSAGHELQEALKFMKDLYKVFPNVTVLTSNHDVRAFKRAKKAGIPLKILKSYEEFFESPKGWKFVDKLEIGNICFVHGHQIATGGGNIMQNAIKKYMKNVVFGHFHTRFGIDYYANEDSLFFGMGVGCLIDHKSYAFEYQRAEVRKPLIGIGIIEQGRPQLIPMILDKTGRWVGRRKK